ncbi:MAG: S26 family signal peptidase, partial [Solirubrobacteraceae bacterium]
MGARPARLDHRQRLRHVLAAEAHRSAVAHRRCDLTTAVAIPPDDSCMMGDDRGASDDSRCRGSVPRDRIVGRACVRHRRGRRS